jgi:hypothetical protein
LEFFRTFKALSFSTFAWCDAAKASLQRQCKHGGRLKLANTYAREGLSRFGTVFFVASFKI